MDLRIAKPNLFSFTHRCDIAAHTHEKLYTKHSQNSFLIFFTSDRYQKTHICECIHYTRNVTKERNIKSHCISVHDFSISSSLRWYHHLSKPPTDLMLMTLMLMTIHYYEHTKYFGFYVPHIIKFFSIRNCLYERMYGATDLCQLLNIVSFWLCVEYLLNSWCMLSCATSMWDDDITQQQ